MFIKTIELRKLKLNKGVVVNLDENTEVAVFLTESGIHCISNICPHQHFPKIYDGFIEDDTVRCPMHGWQFSLISGDIIESEINLNNTYKKNRLKIYSCYEKDGYIWIEKPETNIRPKWSE